MGGKNTAAFAIYPSRSAVEEAVQHLRHSGFRTTDVSVMVPENVGTKDFGHQKGTKAAEGAIVGTIAGGIIGGILAWLLSISVIVVPSISALTVGGPIVAVLAGIGALGALGALIGALAGLGIPEYEAVRYEGRIRDGGVLLSVHCDNSDWVNRAKEGLRHTGGQDIGTSSEKRGDFAVTDKPRPRVMGKEDKIALDNIPEEEPAPRRVLVSKDDSDIV